MVPIDLTRGHQCTIANTIEKSTLAEQKQRAPSPPAERPGSHPPEATQSARSNSPPEFS